MEFEHALDVVMKTRADLCRKCTTHDDFIAVAAALAYQAQLIFTEVGGPHHAAKQFYAMADKLATTPDK